MNPKIKALLPLKSLLARRRRGGKKVVFTNGCFDILHFGHVDYLRKARRCGDLLVVGLNTDRSVRAIKGPDRPVNSQNDRAEVLSELSCVDYVVLFDDPTPLRLIQVLKPDVLVKGADWKLKDIVGHDLVLSYGGRVRRVPLVPGRSTTGTLRKLRGN